MRERGHIGIYGESCYAKILTLRVHYIIYICLMWCKGVYVIPGYSIVQPILEETVDEVNRKTAERKAARQKRTEDEECLQFYFNIKKSGIINTSTMLLFFVIGYTSFNWKIWHIVTIRICCNHAGEWWRGRECRWHWWPWRWIFGIFGLFWGRSTGWVYCCYPAPGHATWKDFWSRTIPKSYFGQFKWHQKGWREDRYCCDCGFPRRCKDKAARERAANPGRTCWKNGGSRCKGWGFTSGCPGL